MITHKHPIQVICEYVHVSVFLDYHLEMMKILCGNTGKDEKGQHKSQCEQVLENNVCAGSWGAVGINQPQYQDCFTACWDLPTAACT